MVASPATLSPRANARGSRNFSDNFPRGPKSTADGHADRATRGANAQSGCHSNGSSSLLAALWITKPHVMTTRFGDPLRRVCRQNPGTRTPDQFWSTNA